MRRKSAKKQQRGSAVEADIKRKEEAARLAAEA